MPAIVLQQCSNKLERSFTVNFLALYFLVRAYPHPHARAHPPPPPRGRKSPRKWSLNHGEADSNDAPSHRDKRSRWQRYFTSVGEKKNISRCRGRDRAFFPRGGTLANPRCTPSHDGGDSHCVNLAKMDFKSDSRARLG